MLFLGLVVFPYSMSITTISMITVSILGVSLSRREGARGARVLLTAKALLVVDLASRDTLQQASQLARYINDQRIVTKLLIGNKLDLSSEREVSFEAARQFAADHGFRYFETSAKDGSLNV